MIASIRIAFLALLTGVTACNIETAVDQIDDAQKAAAFSKRAKDVFKSSVTGVTGVAFEAIQTAMDNTGATAPRIALLADTQVISIDESKALVDGGTVKVSGSITGTRNLSTEMGEIVPALTVTFTDVKVTLQKSDGTSEDVLVSGSETIGGLITFPLVSAEAYSSAATATTEPQMSIELAIKGSFRIDGKNLLFDISLTQAGGDTVMYSGTVNGEQVNETVTAK